jgi:hypothetical protein
MVGSTLGWPKETEPIPSAMNAVGDPKEAADA